MVNALIIHGVDNVVVALQPIPRGAEVRYTLKDEEKSFVSLDDITIYHKIARCDIGKRDSVVKYGERIGEALVDIPMGSHVHVHNISNIKEEL